MCVAMRLVVPVRARFALRLSVDLPCPDLRPCLADRVGVVVRVRVLVAMPTRLPVAA